MRNVLILAREEVVAALLGLMVELHSFQPKFVDRSESVDDVVRQARPGAVLIGGGPSRHSVVHAPYGPRYS